MIRGKVIGRIWSSKRIETLPNGGLLKVETDDGDTLIAFDPLGRAIDQHLLLTQGSLPAAYFTKVKAPVDALII